MIMRRLMWDFNYRTDWVYPAIAVRVGTAALARSFLSRSPPRPLRTVALRRDRLDNWVTCPESAAYSQDETRPDDASATAMLPWHTRK